MDVFLTLVYVIGGGFVTLGIVGVAAICFHFCYVVRQFPRPTYVRKRYVVTDCSWDGQGCTALKNMSPNSVCGLSVFNGAIYCEAHAKEYNYTNSWSGDGDSYRDYRDYRDQERVQDNVLKEVEQSAFERTRSRFITELNDLI